MQNIYAINVTIDGHCPFITQTQSAIPQMLAHNAEMYISLGLTTKEISQNEPTD